MGKREKKEKEKKRAEKDRTGARLSQRVLGMHDEIWNEGLL
jgi:hypothetical protein